MKIVYAFGYVGIIGRGVLFLWLGVTFIRLVSFNEQRRDQKILTHVSSPRYLLLRSVSRVLVVRLVKSSVTGLERLRSSFLALCLSSTLAIAFFASATESKRRKKRNRRERKRRYQRVERENHCVE
jgi:hypothetical protein